MCTKRFNTLLELFQAAGLPGLSEEYCIYCVVIISNNH